MPGILVLGGKDLRQDDTTSREFEDYRSRPSPQGVQTKYERSVIAAGRGSCDHHSLKGYSLHFVSLVYLFIIKQRFQHNNRDKIKTYVQIPTSKGKKSL